MIFKCSIWNNGSNSGGIWVGKKNAKEYFSQKFLNIKVNLFGQEYDFCLDRTGRRTFWGSCPEFRGKIIRNLVNECKLPKKGKVCLKVIRGYKKFKLVEK